MQVDAGNSRDEDCSAISDKKTRILYTVNRCGQSNAEKKKNLWLPQLKPKICSHTNRTQVTVVWHRYVQLKCHIARQRELPNSDVSGFGYTPLVKKKNPCSYKLHMCMHKSIPPKQTSSHAQAQRFQYSLPDAPPGCSCSLGSMEKEGNRQWKAFQLSVGVGDRALLSLRTCQVCMSTQANS